MNKSNYKGFEGDKITAVLSIWSLNVRQLLRDINERPNLMKKLAQIKKKINIMNFQHDIFMGILEGI